MSKLKLYWKKYSFFILFAFIILVLFDMRFALAAVICMAGPIIVSLWKGRYWCGNLCPRGSMYDSLISKISRRKKYPVFLNLFILGYACFCLY